MESYSGHSSTEEGATTMNDEEAQRCLKAVEEFMRLLGVFTVADAIPFLRWFDFGGHERAMKETAKDLDKIFGEWLEEHKRKRAFVLKQLIKV